MKLYNTQLSIAQLYLDDYIVSRVINHTWILIQNIHRTCNENVYEIQYLFSKKLELVIDQILGHIK